MSAYDTLTNLRRKLIAKRLLTPISAPASEFENLDSCIEALDDGLRELVMEPLGDPQQKEMFQPSAIYGPRRGQIH